MEAISTKYVCLQYRVFLKRLANVSTNCNGEFSVNYVKKKKKRQEKEKKKEWKKNCWKVGLTNIYIRYYERLVKKENFEITLLLQLQIKVKIFSTLKWWIEEIKTSREERSGAAVVCYFIASEIRCGWRSIYISRFLSLFFFL